MEKFQSWLLNLRVSQESETEHLLLCVYVYTYWLVGLIPPVEWSPIWASMLPVQYFVILFLSCHGFHMLICVINILESKAKISSLKCLFFLKYEMERVTSFDMYSCQLLEISVSFQRIVLPCPGWLPFLRSRVFMIFSHGRFQFSWTQMTYTFLQLSSPIGFY